MKKATLLAMGLFGSTALLLSGEEPFVFNHTVHTVGQEMACADCHQRVISSADIKGNLLPVPSQCAECHEESLVKGYIGRLAGIPLKGTGFATLRFSHTAHKEVACTQCHGNSFSDEKAASPPLLPTMASCTECHNNRQASASCTVCHEDLSVLRPKDHGPFWRTRAGHGMAARIDEASCAACHKKSDCSDCHAGRFGQTVHEINYEYTHGLDARFKRLDCAVCHVQKNFCSDCHENKK